MFKNPNNTPTVKPKAELFYERLKQGDIKGLPDSFDTFNTAMADSNKRKLFYDRVNESGAVKGLPDFEKFSGLFGDNGISNIEQGITNDEVTPLPQGDIKSLPKTGLAGAWDALQKQGGKNNQGRGMEAANRFSEAFVRPLSVDLLRSFAIGGTKASNALGLTDMDVEDSPVYKFAEDLSKDIDVLFPQNKKYQNEFLARQFPEGLGSAASFMVGGATSAAAKVPAIASSVVLGSSSIAANEFVNAKEAGATDDEAFNAFLLNLPLGATEAIPLGKMMRRLDKVSGGKFTGVLSRKLTNKYAKMGAEALAGGVEEAFQETILQQLPSNIIAGQTYDETKDLFEGLVEGGTTGFAVGLTLNAFGLGVANMRANSDLQLTPEQEAELQKIQDFLNEKLESNNEATQEQTEDGADSGDTGIVQSGEIVPEIGFTFDPEADVTTQLEVLSGERDRLSSLREQFLDNESVVKDIDLALDDIARVESELQSEDGISNNEQGITNDEVVDGNEELGVGESSETLDTSTETLDVSSETEVDGISNNEQGISNEEGTDSETVGQDEDKSSPALTLDKGFKNTKVVDETGSPKKVFHGTNSEFTKFSSEFGGVNTKNNKTGAFFFTDKEDVAKSYGNNLIEAYVNIKNPLIISEDNYKDPEQIDRLSKILKGESAPTSEFYDLAPVPKDLINKHNKDIIKYQEENGHDTFDEAARDYVYYELGIKPTLEELSFDGIIVEGVIDALDESITEGHNVYVALSEDQIKIEQPGSTEEQGISNEQGSGTETLDISSETEADGISSEEQGITNEEITELQGEGAQSGGNDSTTGLEIDNPSIITAKSDFKNGYKLKVRERAGDDRFLKIDSVDIISFTKDGTVTFDNGFGSFITRKPGEYQVIRQNDDGIVEVVSPINSEPEADGISSEEQGISNEEGFGTKAENVSSETVSLEEKDTDLKQVSSYKIIKEPENYLGVFLDEASDIDENGTVFRIQKFKNGIIQNIRTNDNSEITRILDVNNSQIGDPLMNIKMGGDMIKMLNIGSKGIGISKENVTRIFKEKMRNVNSFLVDGDGGKPQTIEEGTEVEDVSDNELLAEVSDNFKKMPISEIKTDVDRFQNRERAFSEETASSIVKDVNAGVLNPDNIPPILVWEDPTNGETYVVGGHSRIEAFKRLKLPTIPTQVLKGISEEQAIERGRTDNALGTQETITEQANLLRDDINKWRSDILEGKSPNAEDVVSKASIKRKADRLFKRNSNDVMALAALNPTGKAIQTVQALEKNQSDDRTRVQTYAGYTGRARLKHPQLTDSHETELFTYLLEHDNTKTKNKNSFIAFVDDLVDRNSFMGDFDASKPLNIKEVKQKTPEQINYENITNELTKESDKARDALKKRIKEIEQKRLAGETINEDAAEKSIKRFQDHLKVAERKLLEHKLKQGEVEQTKRSQQSFFSSKAPKGSGFADGTTEGFDGDFEGGSNPLNVDRKLAEAKQIEVVDEYGRQREITLGELENIVGLELPELVTLVRELTGSTPSISTRFTSTRGVFYPIGDGKIALKASIFKDTKLASQVLAHEIGHLIDYLPEQTMSRGNILGRLLTLRKYLKTTAEGSQSRGEALTTKDRASLNRLAKQEVITESGFSLQEYINDKDIRDNLSNTIKERYQEYVQREIDNRGLLDNKELFKELYTHSKAWRPFNEAEVTEDYLMYRRSSAELYADALSALLVSPGTLQKTAPTFYTEFFEQLDNKPEVKTQFVELQALLTGGRERVLRLRNETINQAFYKAEELNKALIEERENAQQDFVDSFKQSIVNKYHPIIKKVNEAKLAGKVIKASEDPTNLLEELDYKDNVTSTYLYDVGEQVAKPIEDAGMTTLELHKFLLFNRIANEGRVKPPANLDTAAAKEFMDNSDAALDAEKKKYGRAYMANPGGLTAEASQELLDNMRIELGSEQFELLEQSARRFQELNFNFVEQAVEEGVYSRELFEKIIEPNKYNYATFRVLDYIQYPDYVTSAIQESSGTLKDVGSTFDATLLKTVALIQTNAINRAKRNVRDTWINHFSEEISKAKYLGNGKFAKEPGMDHLFVLEDGQRVAYNIDPYIAKVFDYTNPKMLNWFTKLVRATNESVYRPLFITYNPAFVFWSNPIRDFKRLYRNMKEGSLTEIMKSYVDNWQTAKAYSKGEINNPKIRKLIDDFAITPPGEGLVFKDRGDALGRQMERFHLIDGKKNWAQKQLEKNKAVQIVPKLLANIRQKGSMLEILPKLVASDILEAKGVPVKERSYRIRNHFGTPNFKAGGTDKHFTNSIYMFSNIMVQGYKSDIEVATSPNSRGAFWLRFAMLDLLPKLLVRGALLGWMGKELQEFYDRVTEYDKTNYTIIPLGWKGEGVDKEAVYLRVPQDESARLMSSVIWKLTGVLAEDNRSDWNGVFDLGADELPGPAPILVALSKWSKYLSGGNPVDDWRDRPILPTRVHKARKENPWPAFKKMVQWTVNQTGVTSLVTYNEHADSWDEVVMQTTPILNRMIKSTNYGLKEKQNELQNLEDAKINATRYKYGDDVLRMINSTYYLRKLGDARTTEQHIEYEYYNNFYQQVYRPYDEMIQQYMELGDEDAADAAIKALKEFGASYKKTIKEAN